MRLGNKAELICLCLLTHGWILNKLGREIRVSQSFRGAMHKHCSSRKKRLLKITWGGARTCEREEVGRTCQGTEGNSTPSQSHKQKKLFRQLFIVFHNMYTTTSHNLKFFYLPWDLARTCKTNQIPLLQLLQRPVRGPHEINHILKISDTTVHFFQTDWEMQLLGTQRSD